MPSDLIAEMLGINPGVVRRTMSDLRKAGLLDAAKGHGGGWSLARPLGDISLLAVYEALGEPNLFALGPVIDSPTCALETAANSSLREGLGRATNAFRAHLKATTLADLIANASLLQSPPQA